MKIAELGRLGAKHVRSAAAEGLYLKTGHDATRPTSFYAFVNERCNVACRYCEFWRLPRYRDEMTIDEWQAALLSIKAFVGEYSISFTGGEPFIKRDFVSLLEFCRDHGIHSGVTTNGSALTPRVAERVVLARPFNVNISCDAPEAALHDHLRGAPGLFDRLTAGIGRLRHFQHVHGVDFPIIIKPTVCRANFRVLPALVRWAESVGATAVNMQPVSRWTPETYDELWIEPDEEAALTAVVEELVAMRDAGAPIMNTASVLRLMPAHFREEKAPADAGSCRVGLRDFFIRTDGSVEICWTFPPIGNIKSQSARDIWYGETAAEIRRGTVTCDRLCLQTCMSQKRLTDKVRMGLLLLREIRD